jgi:hypothetical protein
MSNRVKKSGTSPGKRGSGTTSSQSMRDLDSGSKLTSKEVEIDHLKSQLATVSTRLHILKDMERDVQCSQALVHDSEQKRAQLQEHI